MRRRDFLRSSAGAGIARGAACALGGYEKLWASVPRVPSAPGYDMVAVMGSTPEAI